MFPTILELGPVKLHSYGLMIALGVLAALYFMQRDAARVGIDSAVISEMTFWAVFLGILGTRVLHIIMFPQNYSWSDPVGWIALWNGGLVFQGAIPVVIVYAWIELRRRKLPFLTMCDIAFPYVPLAQAFGRMGCFLNGCCYGRVAEHLPWAVTFPKGSPAYSAHLHHAGFALQSHSHSLPVHPTQLYSVGGLLLVFTVLVLLRKYWHPFVGFTFPLYLILAGTKRLIVEFYRGDGNPTSLGLGLLSNQQMFCLFMIFLGVGLFWYLRRRAGRIEAARDAVRP